MNNFTIKLFRKGKKATFYTILYDGEDKSELIKFFETYYPTYQEEIQIIRGEMERILEKYGADYDFFRNEGRNYLIALPKAKNQSLRIYCIWRSRELVIFGNGGIKTTRTFQEYEKLNQIANELAFIEQLINEKFNNGEMWEEDRELKGNLYFNLNEEDDE